MEKWAKWKENRESTLTGHLGDLSLVAMQDITQEITIDEFPGKWLPLSADETGLILIAAEEDGLFIDGQSVVGEQIITADVSIVSNGKGLSAMATSQPESNHLLAVWDENCDALKQFESLDHFEYNADLIIKGTFVKDQEQQTFTFTHTSDEESAKGRQHVSPGVIEMTVEGKEYQLRPFASEDHYIVVFRDATSGEESYGMGRMLLVKPAEDQSVILDFNYAFLPPCASSYHFNCPMPPFSNRFTSKINAGEKNISWSTN